MDETSTCADCGEELEPGEVASVEAFECYGVILCDMCAEARFVTAPEEAA